MSDIVCLYCKANNDEREEICSVCGMPLSMSDPDEALAVVGSRKEDSARKLTRYEREEQIRQTSDGPKYLRIYAVIAITVAAVIVGIVFQSRSAIVEEKKQEDTRIILDQNVGASKSEDPSDSNILSEQLNPNYLAGKKAFDEGRYDDAERELEKIPFTDKDYSKAKDLRRDIESLRGKKK